MALCMYLQRQVCLFHSWPNIYVECSYIWFLMRCGSHCWFELVNLEKNRFVPFFCGTRILNSTLSLFLLGICLEPSTFPSLWWLSSTPWPTSPTSPPWPPRSCCPPTLWQWWVALQLLQGQIFFFFFYKRALYILSDVVSFWDWAVFCSEETLFKNWSSFLEPRRVRRNGHEFSLWLGFLNLNLT